MYHLIIYLFYYKKYQKEPFQKESESKMPAPHQKIISNIFKYSSLLSLSSFFTHIETNQSVGGAKTGVPGEKPPDTPASRTWLVPHVTRAPSEARTHSGEMIEWLRALKSATLTTRPRGPPP